jgi:hypothetical protein
MGIAADAVHREQSVLGLADRNVRWLGREAVRITMRHLLSCLSIVALAAGIGACGGSGNGTISTRQRTAATRVTHYSAPKSATAIAAITAGDPANSCTKIPSTLQPGTGTCAELSQVHAISLAAVLTREEVSSALGDPAGTINTVTSDPLTGNGEFAAAIYTAGAPIGNLDQPDSIRIALSSYNGPPPTNHLTQAYIDELRARLKASGIPKSTIDRAISGLERNEAAALPFSQSGYTGFVAPLPSNVALLVGQTEADLYGHGVKIVVLGDSSHLASAPASTKDDVLMGLARLVAERVDIAASS